MAPPRLLLEALRLDDGADALETAATVRFLRPDGDTTKADVWLVRDAHRLWLAAASKRGAWSVAARTAEDAKLQRALTRDTVTVAGYTAPLRRRTSDAAEAILSAFAEAVRREPEDADDAPAEPVDGGPSSANTQPSHPFLDVAPWWSHVPASDDDPWLFAVVTRSRLPVADARFGVVEVPLVVAVSERAMHLATCHERTAPRARWVLQGFDIIESADHVITACALEGEVDHVAKLGRDELRIGAWRLSLDDDDAVALATVAKLDGEARLAWILEHALTRRDARAAGAYVERIVHRLSLAPGSATPSESRGPIRAAPALAALDLAAERFDDALALLAQPGVALDARADVLRLTEHAKATLDDELRERLPTIPSPPPATPPRGFLWPPQSADVLWSAAATLQGRVDDAIAYLESLAEPERTHARLAIEAHADEGAVSLDAWREVAEAFAATGAYERAATIVARAIERTPTAALHVRAAAWRWRDGQRDAACDAIEAAAEAEPTAEELAWLVAAVAPAERSDPSVAERLLGKIAELTRGTSADPLDAFLGRLAERGHSRVAAKLLVEHAFHGLVDDDVLDAAATRCAEVLDAPHEAALLVEALARRSDDREEETGPHWLRAASYRARASEHAVATNDLACAIAADFLRPATYRAALTTDRVALPSDVEAWWRHLLASLEGDAAERAPIPAAPKLDANTLDTLHPGGVGWLDQLRQAVQEVEPPSHASLTRGLERLSAERYPETAATIGELCLALDIAQPDCFLYRGDDAHGVCVWPIDKPVLLLGHRHLEPGPFALADDALRFIIGVELTHLACRHPLLSFEADFLGTSHSVYQQFGRYAGAAETLVDVVTMLPGVDQVAKLQRIVKLSRRVFTAKSAVDKVGSLAAPLKKLFGDGDAGPRGIGRNAMAGAALQFRMQADRAALLLTPDFVTAVDSLLAASGRPEDKRRAILGRGLAAALESDALEGPEKLRISALAEFAAKQMPFTPGARASENAT